MLRRTVSAGSLGAWPHGLAVPSPITGHRQRERLVTFVECAGVAAGDRTGIMVPNTVRFAVAFYGILRRGPAERADNDAAVMLYTRGDNGRSEGQSHYR